MNTAVWRLISTYGTIFFTIFICETISFWFYPVAILILANQYSTLMLLGHEGVHGVLHKNRFVNRAFARYFCHFPFLISHTHYSMNHLRHHRYLGTNDDPDSNIYKQSYPSFSKWVAISIRDTINFSLLRRFLSYFNGSKSYFDGKYPYNIKTDYLSFYCFWALVVASVFFFGVQNYFSIYWSFPLILSMPWIQLMNSYQHYSEDGPIAGLAYNIILQNKLQKYLFPININFHEVHHQRPDIPYYELPLHYVKSQNSIVFSEFSKRVFSGRTNKSL